MPRSPAPRGIGAAAAAGQSGFPVPVTFEPLWAVRFEIDGYNRSQYPSYSWIAGWRAATTSASSEARRPPGYRLECVQAIACGHCIRPVWMHSRDSRILNLHMKYEIKSISKISLDMFFENNLITVIN